MNKTKLLVLTTISVLLLIDYSFFFKKISNYKNDVTINKNFIVLTGGNHRVKKALELFFKVQSKNKNLLISGVGKGFSKNTIKQLTKNKPEGEYIIKCCIEIEGVSKNTFYNAVESLKWVKTKKIKSFILLTNNYHMPRAMLEFENIFKNIKIFPYVFTDKNQIWWKNYINFITEYLKYNLTYLRINLMQF